MTENEIAEATQLLTAVAEDKSAEIDKDRKVAATAYRNLNAIAGLRDPKRALKAYEKALALDPDDLERLYWAGYLQIDHGDLGKAQARLERVLTLAKTDGETVYKYWAITGLGDIKQARGRPYGRAEVLLRQPCHCRPPGGLRPRRCQLAI